MPTIPPPRMPFSAYLWGIETPLFFHEMLSITAFSAYLWGIETYRTTGNESYCCPGFQPTYEELKPRSRTTRSRAAWTGFQPTYEELKHTDKYLWVFYFQSFQPTYEELKPPGWPLVYADRAVFSLPMRNWNSTWTLCRKGISFCFQPTYEELKPASLIPEYQREVVFSLPMRNWNKRQSPGRPPAALVFSLPMRNWNISSSLSPLFRKFSRFSAYLWGIETCTNPC